MTRALSHPLRRPAPERPSPLDGLQHIVLEGASWDLYERLLRDVGGRNIRINYDQGRLEMMSPLPEHERPSRVICHLIFALTGELRIACASYGSTTFHRREKEKGLEPDECLYFKNERQMRGRKRLLKRDPPPELVVEIDITNPSVPREPIYAGLGVPEIWRWDGARLTCLELIGGEYRPRRQSLSFPFLEPAELTRFIKAAFRKGEHPAVQKFVGWVRKQEWVK